MEDEPVEATLTADAAAEATASESQAASASAHGDRSEAAAAAGNNAGSGSDDEQPATYGGSGGLSIEAAWVEVTGEGDPAAQQQQAQQDPSGRSHSSTSSDPSAHKRLHAAYAHLSTPEDAEDHQLSIGSAGGFTYPSRSASELVVPSRGASEIQPAMRAAVSPRGAGDSAAGATAAAGSPSRAGSSGVGDTAEDWGSHPRSRHGSVAALAGARRV